MATPFDETPSKTFTEHMTWLSENRGISISVEQVRLLEELRGLTPTAFAKMSEGKLRRAVRRIEFPDMPRGRERFRRLQIKDENGQAPTPAALTNAGERLQQARREARAQRSVAGIPTGAPVRVARGLQRLAGLTQAAWVPIGPGNIGGRTRSIVCHPTQPQMMWAASAGGGVWRTVDGGSHWEPVNDFLANLAVSCLVMHPSDPNIMYAATGEGFSNVDALRGGGIFFTTDGSNWAHLTGTDSAELQLINRLAISRNGKTLLAATPQGLFRSTDAKHHSWSKVLDEPLGDVRFSPSLSTRAVAGSLDRGAAFYSTNSGKTWKVAAHASPWEGRVELTYAKKNAAIVYASIDVAKGEIWRSTDGGKSYTRRANQTPAGRPAHYLSDQGWYANTIWAGDPINENLVIVGGLDLWRSLDGGDTLRPISTWWDSGSVHADHHSIVAHGQYNGTTNRTVFFGNDGGIYRASDVTTAGNDADEPFVSGWQELNNTYAVTQFYGAAGNAATGVIIGGAQDNGTLCYKPAAGSEAWTTIFGGDGGWCAADSTDAKVFYGEYVYLGIHRNTDGASSDDQRGDRYINGQFWNSATNSWDWKPAPFRIPDSMTQKTLFIAPFVLDPNDSNRILGGGSSLWRTNDAKTPNTKNSGPRWSAIKAPTGNFISAIAVARGDSDLVWVGHIDGAIFKTINGTSLTPIWQRIDTNGPTPLLARRYCTRIVIDPSDKQTVYICFGGYSAGNLWKTTDSGATWRDISAPLPDVPIRTIAIHPARRAFLYAGSEVGIFASEDGGASWSPGNEGPTNCSVDELFWMNKKLVCATHGRGMFTIDLSAI